jgi:hypothetical protein
VAARELSGGGRQAEVAGNASFLNQGLKVSLVEPRLGRPGTTTEFSGSAERTRQLTYDWESYGARAAMVYRNEAGTDGTREPGGMNCAPATHEFLKYGIHPDSLGDLTRRDERIAPWPRPDHRAGLRHVGLDRRRRPTSRRR